MRFDYVRLFEFIDKVKHDRNQHAQDNTCHDREIESKISSLNPNITWKLPKKWNSVIIMDEQPDDDQNYSGYY